MRQLSPTRAQCHGFEALALAFGTTCTLGADTGSTSLASTNRFNPIEAQKNVLRFPYEVVRTEQRARQQVNVNFTRIRVKFHFTYESAYHLTFSLVRARVHHKRHIIQEFFEMSCVDGFQRLKLLRELHSLVLKFLDFPFDVSKLFS